MSHVYQAPLASDHIRIRHQASKYTQCNIRYYGLKARIRRSSYERPLMLRCSP